MALAVAARAPARASAPTNASSITPVLPGFSPPGLLLPPIPCRSLWLLLDKFSGAAGGQALRQYQGKHFIPAPPPCVSQSPYACIPPLSCWPVSLTRRYNATLRPRCPFAPAQRLQWRAIRVHTGVRRRAVAEHECLVDRAGGGAPAVARPPCPAQRDSAAVRGPDRSRSPLFLAKGTVCIQWRRLAAKARRLRRCVHPPVARQTKPLRRVRSANWAGRRCVHRPRAPAANKACAPERLQL